MRMLSRLMPWCLGLAVLLLWSWAPGSPPDGEGGALREEPSQEPGRILVPVVKGDWWQIAGDGPDVTPFRITQDSTSNVCDFTLYRDAKGTWHAIACVRGTNAPGARVFHHWISPKREATDWRPRGVLDWPRGKRAGKPTSVQAPHAFVHKGKYYCFYNSGQDGARAMISDDGITWKVFHSAEGAESLFSMGRDVNLFYHEEKKQWQATYTGNYPGREEHAMVARTAKDLAGPWSDPPFPVKTSGNPESPFLVRRGERYYLLQQMSVYVSQDPRRFGSEPLTHLTGLWYNGKWAPEIITHQGQDYLAAYGRGLWLARLDWVPMTPAQAEAHAKPILEKIRQEREEAQLRKELRLKADSPGRSSPPG